MINIYLRQSTNRQDEQEQMNIINNYLSANKLTADRIIKDDGVSGGVSYKDRNLYKLVTSCDSGDTIIVSEISRIGRSMSDLNKLVSDELKPRKLRLIVVSMGLDLDCANMKALDEMILFAFSFSAQIEKEMIQSRTISALEARRKNGKAIGGTKKLWGKNSDKDNVLKYRNECISKANAASVESRKEKAKLNDNNKSFVEFIYHYEKQNGSLKNGGDFKKLADELNKWGKKTSTGLPFNSVRARAMLCKVNNLYN